MPIYILYFVNFHKNPSQALSIPKFTTVVMLFTSECGCGDDILHRYKPIESEVATALPATSEQSISLTDALPTCFGSAGDPRGSPLGRD